MPVELGHLVKNKLLGSQVHSLLLNALLSSPSTSPVTHGTQRDLWKIYLNRRHQATPDARRRLYQDSPCNPVTAYRGLGLFLMPCLLVQHLCLASCLFVQLKSIQAG